jgi:serine-type D-Ala-D-Ala carboxypeptidase/endopeptidase (penicillin-binding protein 4)
MKTYFLIIGLALSLASCIGQGPRLQNQVNLEKVVAENNLGENHHWGLMLFDPQTGETVYSKNANMYFVPASNVKILTLFASLQVYGDSLPAMKYIQKGDSTVLWGLGGPGLFHPYLPDINPFGKLKSGSNLFFSGVNFREQKLGSGWSWDDYNDDYQVERSSLPVFGNILKATKDKDNISYTPNLSFFKSKTESEITEIKRDLNKNDFGLPVNFKKNQDVPFVTSDSLTLAILNKTLGTEIKRSSLVSEKNAEIIYGYKADTVYRRMMQISDNMLAEQLLLGTSGTFSDTLSTTHAIAYFQKNYLANTPQKIKWVDGSGLSRYNLITPETLVYILNQLWQKTDHDYLLSLLASSEAEGTLKNLYGNQKATIFAKSGSMSGVYNQSGYMYTATGRLLIFSVMNNNFTASVSQERKATSKLISELSSSL